MLSLCQEQQEHHQVLRVPVNSPGPPQQPSPHQNSPPLPLQKHLQLAQGKEHQGQRHRLQDDQLNLTHPWGSQGQKSPEVVGWLARGGELGQCPPYHQVQGAPGAIDDVLQVDKGPDLLSMCVQQSQAEPRCSPPEDG